MNKKITSLLMVLAVMLFTLPAQAQTVKRVAKGQFAPHKIHQKFTAADMARGEAAKAKMAEATLYRASVSKAAGEENSDPADETVQTGANVDAIPYVNTFDTAEEQAQFAIVNANGDDKTWVFSTVNACYSYGSEAANDWLISPAIKLEAGVLYRIAVDAKSQSPYYAEKFEVKVGKEPKANALTTVAIAPTEVASTAYETYENEEFTVAETGYYHFGIHAISEAEQWNLYVDNFTVELGLKPEAPAAPQLEVLPGIEGDQAATVKVTAPTTTVAGSDLTENLTKMVVMRNGEQLTEMTDVAPGAVVRYLDEPAEPGTYSYQVIPYNSIGKGQKSEVVAKYIGLDVPAEIEEANVAETADGLDFTWTPVGSEGPNGGYVNPNDVAYKMWTVDLISFWGMTFPSLTDLLGEATAVDHASVAFDTEEGQQEFKYFAVQPTNATGAGAEAYTQGIMIGKSYELPFNEGFAGSQLHYYWASNGSFLVTEDATDGDGVACYLTAQKAGQVYIESGKISLKNSVNPVLTFDAKGSNINALYVLGAQDGGEYETLQQVALNNQYQTVKVPLTAYKDSRYAQFALVVAVATPTTFDDNGYVASVGDGLTIDGIRVTDLYEYNLAAQVEASAKVVLGQTAKVKATVENIGENDATGYTVTIKAGNRELLAETVDEPLTMFKRKTFEAELPTTVFDAEDDINITAEVAFTNDLDDEDNKAETIIAVEAPAVPTPENLKATDKGDEGVGLTWAAPNITPTVAEVTESFENGLGDWTMIDADEDGNNWTLNETQEGDQDAPLVLSGKNSVFSASYDNTTGALTPDNWLVSPKAILDGTVKVWAVGQDPNYSDEHFAIYVSTESATDVTTFTKVSDEFVATGDWAEYTADLSAYAGQEGWIAIRHYNCTDMFELVLDDITYSAITGDFTLLNYNVYYEGELIATVADGETTYTVAADKLQAGKRRTFDVTAVYEGGIESLPVTANVTVTTDIQQIVADGKPVDVYSLDGKLVRQQAKSLDGLKGVFVIKGKTVIVK